MATKKKPKVRVRRIHLVPSRYYGPPSEEREFTPFHAPDIPERWREQEATSKYDYPSQLEPYAHGVRGVVKVVPYDLPEEGDPVETEGYIDFLRIDEKGYAAGLRLGENMALLLDPTFRTQLYLEDQTYCLVGISQDKDKSTNVIEFRVMYDDLKGEYLAVSMAVIAALKDAFLERSRVRLHGIVSADDVSVPKTIMGGEEIHRTQEYFALESVVLLRS